MTPQPTTVKGGKSLAAKLTNGEKLSVARRPFSQALERVQDSLMESEMDLILHGTFEDLRRGGDCWDVLSYRSFGNVIEGYLDARRGELVFLWIFPEG